jgi:hypothetical protein
MVKASVYMGVMYWQTNKRNDTCKTYSNVGISRFFIVLKWTLNWQEFILYNNIPIAPTQTKTFVQSSIQNFWIDEKALTKFYSIAKKALQGGGNKGEVGQITSWANVVNKTFFHVSVRNLNRDQSLDLATWSKCVVHVDSSHEWKS